MVTGGQIQATGPFSAKSTQDYDFAVSAPQAVPKNEALDLAEATYSAFLLMSFGMTRADSFNEMSRRMRTPVMSNVHAFVPGCFGL
jgi:hypothetical protein